MAKPKSRAVRLEEALDKVRAGVEEITTTKRYVMADGKTWTDDREKAGRFATAGLAGQVLRSWDTIACIVLDDGSWLVTTYVDPEEIS